MSDARLDFQRRQRLGMVEAIWGQHKTADQIIAILRRFLDAEELALVTRVQPSKAAEALLGAAAVPTAAARAQG